MRTIVLGSTGQWPVIAIAVAIAVSLCLWGLFRRGSMSDRARSEEGQSTGDQ